MMAKRDNHQQHGPGQAYEVGAQIHVGNEVLRLSSLWVMHPRFLDIEPQFISLLRSNLLMGQTAPSHLCVECDGSFWQQVSAITRDVQ